MTVGIRFGCSPRTLRERQRRARTTRRCEVGVPSHLTRANGCEPGCPYHHLQARVSMVVAHSPTKQTVQHVRRTQSHFNLSEHHRQGRDLQAVDSATKHSVGGGVGREAVNHYSVSAVDYQFQAKLAMIVGKASLASGAAAAHRRCPRFSVDKR